MRLQWPPRLAIQVHHNAIRVTRQIHPDRQLDLHHLLVDLGLLLRLRLLDVRLELARDARHRVEEVELQVVEVARFAR
jgi:hypothetical protein